MLRVREHRPLPVMNAEPKTFCSTFYELAPPATLLNCRLAIQDRHIGGPWPSVISGR